MPFVASQVSVMSDRLMFPTGKVPLSLQYFLPVVQVSDVNFLANKNDQILTRKQSYTHTCILITYRVSIKSKGRLV